MLQVKNITFSYQKTPVLKDISFKVKPGDYLAIIGVSGSGKSTLLKVLRGEYDLKKGHVFWKENEILGPKHNLVIGYDFIKYVAQEFELEPFISVAENIGQHLSNFYKEEKKERVTELLEIVELTAFAKTKVKTRTPTPPGTSGSWTRASGSWTTARSMTRRTRGPRTASRRRARRWRRATCAGVSRPT